MFPSDRDHMSGRLISFAEKTGHPLLAVIVLGVIIRIILAPTLTFNIDVAYWAEVIDVFQNGFGLYGTAGYYYTPIWGYCLGFIAFIMQILGITDFGTFAPELYHLVNESFKISAYVTSVEFNTVLKLFLIAVDVAVAVIIYRFTMKFADDERKGCFASLLWMLSPLIITQSSVHGMFDNISALLILLTVMAAIDRKYLIAGSLFSLAVLTKFFPLFFAFFLIACVLKKEGVNADGAKCLLKALAGFFVTAAIVYIPNIANGDFWSSFYFLAYRLGIDRGMLSSIGPIETAVVFTAIAVLIAAVLLIAAAYGERIMAYAHSIDPKVRDHKVAVFLAVIALLLIVALLVRTFLSADGLLSLGFGGVAAVCIFSIFLEVYLGYRLLMSERDDGTFRMTLLFLTATAVILWPCAPSYVLVMVPFIIIYAVTVDTGYVKPYIVMSVALTLMEITAYMTSPTSLIMALTGDVSVMVPVYEFLAYPVFMDITGTTVLTAVFGSIAYFSVIYIPFRWYRAYYREGKS